MKRARILMGVDGGGTSCRVALSRPANAAARIEARGGPSNISDFPRAMASVAEAVGQVLAVAGVGAEDMAGVSIHLGLAGVMDAAQAAEVRSAILARFPFGAVGVSDDQPTMAAGALGGRPGTVAAIGTGSFIARETGVFAKIGGWGFRIGDQSSGAWLGRRLLEEVMLAVDGLRPATNLTHSILVAHGGRPSAIVAFAIGAGPADFARLAPDVVAAAAAGDPVAVMLMGEGATYIAAAARQLGWRPGEALCLAGGLGESYRAWLPADLQRDAVAARGTALDGALLLAGRGGVT